MKRLINLFFYSLFQTRRKVQLSEKLAVISMVIITLFGCYMVITEVARFP